MVNKYRKLAETVVAFLFAGSLVAGCGTPQAPATPSTPSTSTTQTTTPGTPALADVIKKGLPGTGVAMRGVSDSFDNMYYAAKGGNWGLAAYMSDVMQDYMSPIEISRTEVYPQWASFVKANLGDDGALKKAMDAKDMTAFNTAYNNTINNCNSCHTALGFKFIKKIKAAAPEANLDYSLASNASDNK